MPSQSNDKQDLWKSRIDQYRTSGLSAKVWCDKNHVSYHAMKYWNTKLNKKSTDKPKSPAPVFVAVPAGPASHSKPPIVIHLGNVSIEVSDVCNSQLLSDLIGILKNYA